MSIWPMGDNFVSSASDLHIYIDEKAAYTGGNYIKGVKDYLKENPEYNIFEQDLLNYAKEKQIDTFGMALWRIHADQYVMAFVKCKLAYKCIGEVLSKEETINKLIEGCKILNIVFDKQKLESEYERFLSQENKLKV